MKRWSIISTASVASALFVILHTANLCADTLSKVAVMFEQSGIEFTSVPLWGSFDDLRGRVWGVNPSEYRVAVYIYLKSAGGWWTKPTFESPLTRIEEDSTWTTDITTGGIDQYATQIIAFLVPDGFDPPLGEGHPVLPDSLFQNPYAIESRLQRSRSISFSGYSWVVKGDGEEMGRVGPGPNFFSDKEEDVWVDGEGLHLTITQKSGNWFCTEVIADTSFGYGTYVFQVQGRIDALDPNIVLGLFTWDEHAPLMPTNANENFREMDIEFSKWGQAHSDLNAQFVVQPWETAGNRYQFNIQLSDDTISTHRFTWKEDVIHFQSVYGNATASWGYTGDDIPLPGDENPRINFWLYRGSAPVDGQDAEIVIRSFEFLPPPTGIDNDISNAPTVFILEQNYPNPFNAGTAIRYQLSEPSNVELVIYNTLGQRVRTLVNESHEAMHQTVRWNARDELGVKASSGVYLYRLKTDTSTQMRKMLLLE